MQNVETGDFRKMTQEAIEELSLKGFITGPVFHEGEVLNIKGGWWRVQKIWKNRMKLKSISTKEAQESREGQD